MSIFEIIADAVDGFDEKFEDTLQFLNEKIEKAENRKNNKTNTRIKRTSSKNSNAASVKEISGHTMSKYKKSEKETISYNNENIENKELKKDISINIINRCKDKIKEIKELIENLDYSSRKSYEDSCIDLEKSLEYIKTYNDLNKTIEYINNLYRSAYYKKHNKSSLAFIMDDDNELDLIKLEDINE